MARIAYEYLIIGGGIAGVTAAETIKEKHPTATIAIISEEPHLLYSRVLIPSYLKRKISRDKLFLRRAEDFTQKGIDLHLNQRVISVEPGQRLVNLGDGLVFQYKKLLIASGGKTKPWGEENFQKYILRMQTLDDADQILSSLPSLQHPLVVGSSFIGLEFLEVFSLQGLRPSVLTRDSYYFSKFLDPQGGEIMQNNFARNGIESYFQDSVREIKIKENPNPGQGIELKVATEKLLEISCDSIAAAIGIERHTGFLSGSGMELGLLGVRTNEFLETNIAGVYAAGDVAEFFNVHTQKFQVSGNWTDAFLQGKQAGLNMAGSREPYHNISAYSITNLGLQITVLGDYAPDMESMVRIDVANEQYERIFLKEGVIVGAALINRFQDKPHLTKLIATKTPVGDFRQKLIGFSFDIKEITPLS